MSSLSYSNTSDTPPASVQIDWTFNDGNTGAQGTGGELTALGSTIVNITPAPNTPPSFIFDEEGKIITDFFGDSDIGNSVALQADGKILVAGTSGNEHMGKFNLALARYNSDGSLDTGLSGDGKVTDSFGFISSDFARSITVQADGKILVAGSGSRTTDSNFDFAVARYNSDGSLDTDFSGDGLVTTSFDFTSRDFAAALTVQADGKILVAGTSEDDFALVRYNSDGSLDTGFSGDGLVTTSFDSTSNEFASAVTVQADGKILVAGSSAEDFALARYNSDGSLDTGFSGDGLVTTSFDFTSNDFAASVTVQADGKILAAGISDSRFALARYNSDGSLDTGFSGDGLVTTSFGSTSRDFAASVAVQADGKILMAGTSDGHFALARYNADGSLDTGFSGDGKVLTELSPGSSSMGSSVIVQADGKIIVAGTSNLTGTIYNGPGSDFAVVRYNADGSLDNTFGVPVNTLDGIASYTENGPAVVLDSAAYIYDAELEAQGNYNGASITLARHGGANSEDIFSVPGTFFVRDGNLYLVDFRVITHLGTISNSNGALTITFNSNATQARVNAVLSSLNYSNTSDHPPASVQIDWTFNDGNTGAQGTGGELTALGSTLVNITPPPNTPPSFIFDEEGKVITDFTGDSDIGNSVVIQADGKILVAGFSRNFGSPTSGENDFAIVRYNADGSLDTSFSGDGKVSTTLGSKSFDSANFVTVQADGKILAVGTSDDDFALVRYNSDGSLDTDFSGDGKVTTDLGSNSLDSGNFVTVQADGKILVAGFSGVGLALARYNSDGSLDTGFSGDGKVTTTLSITSRDFARSVTVQADGKILVAGTSPNPNADFKNAFALARYNSDGSLDTGFSGDGLVTTSFDSTSNDLGSSVAVQADGKILAAGSSDGHFALVRYNSDGSLDTGFSGDGKVTTTLSITSRDFAHSVTVQADGKILVAGTSPNSNADFKNAFTLVRYNSDGSLDTGFSGDGIEITAVSSVSDSAESVIVQADGKIVVAGNSYYGGDFGYMEIDFAVMRYNADGTLDNTFGVPVNTLDGIACYTENGDVVILDRAAYIYDAELNAQGNYNGASITLTRHGGANSEDIFSVGGVFVVRDGNLYHPHIRAPATQIGAVSNSNGALTITFNANATQAIVNSVLSSLSYSNTSDTPPASVQIDWTFNDGNTGAQGPGGALTDLGSTVVNITPVDDSPVLTTPAAICYTDTVFDDSFATAAGSLVATDADSSALTYGISGGTDNGAGAVVKSGLFGVLTVIKATGAYSFAANDAAIEALTVNAGDDFTVTVSDGSLTDSKTLAVDIVQNGKTESTGNDTLTGASGNDKFDGLAGADTMKGHQGNDVYIVDNAGDKVIEISPLATEIDTVKSSISYTLGAHVENLTLLGTEAINGTGNVFKNVLIGNAAANILFGRAGNDVLKGEAGNDVLRGGNGNDVLIGDLGKDLLIGGIGDDIFRLTTLAKDIFVDFRVAEDTVQLENSVFTQLTTSGVLNSDNFRTGPVAADANDYIIYNGNTGALFYDADGNGSNAAVQIAVLGGNPALTFADFVVI